MKLLIFLEANRMRHVLWEELAEVRVRVTRRVVCFSPSLLMTDQE